MLENSHNIIARFIYYPTGRLSGQPGAVRIRMRQERQPGMDIFPKGNNILNNQYSI